jgi:hypothetical protein
MNDNAIFINCPFDEEYQPLLRALLFAALFYGLDIKIASMDSDSKSDRLKRIIELMKVSRYSIHDLSRMQARKKGEYYRMNMPFELGLDYGLCGDAKCFLIFENNPYKLKVALSDVNGWDVRSHNEEAINIVTEFRKWYVAANKQLDKRLKSVSSANIWYQYNEFQVGFERFKSKHHLMDKEISVSEYIDYVKEYFRTQK